MPAKKAMPAAVADAAGGAKKRGRPSLVKEEPVVASATDKAPALNANVWLLHKTNVDKVLTHRVFENVRDMAPLSINTDNDQVGVPRAIVTLG